MLCYDWDSSPLPIFWARPELAWWHLAKTPLARKSEDNIKCPQVIFSTLVALKASGTCSNGLHLGCLQHALGCGIVQGCTFEIERCVTFVTCQPIDCREMQGSYVRESWWEVILLSFWLLVPYLISAYVCLCLIFLILAYNYRCIISKTHYIYI